MPFTRVLPSLWMLSLLIFMTIIRETTSVCSTPLFKSKFDYKLVRQNAIVRPPDKNLTVTNRLMCAVSCRNYSRCVAFAYHRITKECNLFTYNINKSTTWESEIGIDAFVMDIDIDNIAALKPTYESSVKSGRSSSQAVDGDTRAQHYNPPGDAYPCFQTANGDYYPWFLVDLEAMYLVEIIVVYNADGYPERLHDVSYEVFQTNPQIDNTAVPNCCAFVVRYNLGRNIIRCNPGVTGQFVKISIEKSDYLTLCEVEIFGRLLTEVENTTEVQTYACSRLPEGPNIAVNKPAQASSTFGVTQIPWANDGNKDGNYFAYSCHSTSDPPNGWWQVDLQGNFNITSFTLSNRVDGKDLVYYRLSNVSILVYQTQPSQSAPNTLCKFIPGAFGCTIRTFECDQITIGRWVRVSIPTNYLTLCEVEVTGNAV